ncbi:hypothetical protein M2140_000757 [Clostridiales Family XIII bacterium PM5-7]
MKKGVIIILAILVTMTNVPMEAFGALMDKGEIVTISEGRELVGSDDKPYYLAKGYYNARFSNKAGTGFDYRVCLAVSPKKIININNGKSKYQGYCLEHGAWMNPGSTKYTGSSTNLMSLFWLKPYKESTIRGIELTLLFGKQPGMSAKDVPVSGCNLDDWYFATQNILWEYQQGLRTSPTSIRSNPKTQAADWYSKTMKGRPAYKMYKWMLEQMEKYDKALSFTAKDKDKAPLLKLTAQEDGTWKGTFVDAKKLGQDIETTNKHISITREGNTYTVISKLSPEKIGTVDCTKHVPKVEAKQPLLAFTTGQNSSISNHLQSVVWGATDPVKLYFRLGEGTTPETGGSVPVLPFFHLDLEKRDKHLGFDGNTSSGMGDAALNASIGVSVETQDGIYEDMIDLDEYGTCDGYSFRPWIDTSGLTRTETNEDEHQYITYTGSATVNTWEEIVPDGRFSEEESSTGTGTRSHKINYWAQSVDGGPFTYNLTVDGTSYTKVDEEIELMLKPDVYVNDLYRGRLQIIKTKTDLDPYTDNRNGSSSEQYSTKSKWTVRLESEGSEGNPYIRVVPLTDGEKGFDAFANNYKVVKDSSGSLADEHHPLTVSKFGQINIVDLPFGSYRIDEVAADSEGYVLESFVVQVTEHGQLISKSIENVPKTNQIKVVKVNAETGKTVRVKDTAFRIKYLGRPDVENPEEDIHYGKYLSNGSGYTDGKNYIFECDINGQIALPYPLEYGHYQLEEIVVPEGYYTEPDGNVYSFSVTKQNSHMDGDDYQTYYVTLNMENNPVKGSVSVEKEGEVLSGWELIKEGIYTLHRAIWNSIKLPGVEFDIYAAEDIMQKDGVTPVSIVDANTGKKIPLTLTVREHGDKEDAIEKWAAALPTGEKITRTSMKKKSDQNKTVTEYHISNTQGMTYREQFTNQPVDGIKTSYTIEYELNQIKGGMAYTNIHVQKTYTKVKEDVEVKLTKPLLKIGDEEQEIIDVILPNGNRILQHKPNVEKEIDERTILQEYDFQVMEHVNAKEGFTFSFDGISLTSKRKDSGQMETIIKGFDGVKPEITTKGGYTYSTKNNTTVVTAVDGKSIPVYFMTGDGIETSMMLSSGMTNTHITVKQSQLFTFDGVYPRITYNGNIIDWASALSPDNHTFEEIIDEKNYINVERLERSSGRKETTYAINIVSNQTDEQGFIVTYPDTTECIALISDHGETGTLRFTATDHTLIYPIGSPVETITTGKDGKAVSSKLPLGTYYVHEKEGTIGHINQGQWKLFTLTHKDQYTPLVSTTERFSNRGINVKIDLKKLFETRAGSNDYVSGSGAIFGIYTGAEISGKDNGVKADALVGVLHVSKGSATTTVKLPMGKYYVKELKAPTGYIKDEAKYYFDVEDVLEAGRIRFHDKDIGVKGKITHNGGKVVKVELDTLYRFPSAETKITGGKVVTSVLKGRTITTVESTGETINIQFEHGGTLTIEISDQSYIARFDGKQPVFLEGKADTEIFYQAKVVNTSFRSVATWKNIETLDKRILTFISPLATSKITATADEEDSVLLSDGKTETKVKAGESTEIVFDDGASFTAKLDEKGKLNLTCTGQYDGRLTGKSQLLIDGEETLPQDAQLKHTEARTYARHDATVDTINVVIDSITNDRHPDYPGIVPEIPEKGKLELIKKDGATGKKLSGAKFQLINSVGETIATKTTNDEGRVMFSDLTPGTYFYREIKAPKGYLIDEEYYRVEVNGGKTISITIVNHRETEKPENTESNLPDKTKQKLTANQNPKTGDDARMPIMTLMMSLAALIGLLRINRKPKNTL